RHQLLIYDPQVSDDSILKVILERVKAGVDVKIIGKVEAKWKLKAEKFPGSRLHVRAIIRDGHRAFVGSQSLRKLELERRREIGIIADDKKVVAQIQKTFLDDWALTPTGKKEAKKAKKAKLKPGRDAAA